MSAAEFQATNFLERLFAILDETGLDLKLFELELTESVLMKRANPPRPCCGSCAGEAWA
jgi:hypothetical protein